MINAFHTFYEVVMVIIKYKNTSNSRSSSIIRFCSSSSSRISCNRNSCSSSYGRYTI